MEERDVEIEEAERAAELETGCDIDANTAKEEATWYSLLNTIGLCLGSGMGIPLDQPERDRIFKRIGVSQDELPLKNPELLKALFKNGDPGLTQQYDMQYLSTWRWNPSSFGKQVVPQAQGWAIMQECEASKWFAIPQSSKGVSEELKRDWGINGMLLCALAREQCLWAFENLRNEKRLFITAAQAGSINVTEPATSLEDQTCMLGACSDLSGLLGDSEAYPMYADRNASRRFMGLADDLFGTIVENKDTLLNTSESKILAQAVAIPALVWYAANTQAQDLKAKCLWLLREFADNLVRAQDKSETVGDTLVDAAAALRALVEAFRVTRAKTYAETAMKVFNYIESQWWKQPGTYAPTPLAPEYTFNADDIGTILGALNASHLFLGERVDRDLAELRLRIFFCNAVNLSGLQMSMPSPQFMPVWLQQREPAVHFRHGSIPLPPQAGGDFGVAPVFAGEVAYDPQSDTWSRRMMFDTPAAMHACCEFLWMNHEAVNGFPEIKLEEAPIAVRHAAGVEAEA